MNALVAPLTLKYKREYMSSVLEQIEPLLAAHWQEIAHYRDIPVSPNWQAYWTLEANDALRIYTVRRERALVGYGIYFVTVGMHYAHSKQAAQDVIYLHPDYRRGGTGSRLITFADDCLRREGVQVVQQHVKAAHNFGPLLVRQGYELQDLIYTKRLDR